MFKLKTFYQNTSSLADLLPWICLVAPGVVLNKDGSLQRTFRFRGPDLASASSAELNAAMLRLNNVLKRFGSGWVVYVEAAREKISLSLPATIQVNPVALLIDLEHHQRFTESENNFSSYYYFTIQYLPPTQFQQSLFRRFIRQAALIQRQEEKILQDFTEQTQQVFLALQDVCYEVRYLSDDETLTYLHQCISVNKQSVVMPEVPMYLDALLADSPLLTGLEPKLANHFLGTLTILGFPSHSLPSILDGLNHLSFAYRWMTRYIAIDKLEAEGLLKRHRQRWFAKRKNIFNLLQEVFLKQESALQDQTAIKYANEVDQALALLSEESVAYGYFTCTVTIIDENQEQLKRKLQEVQQVIQGMGFTTIIESFNAVEAWLSSLPGHAYANVRKPLLHTLNLAHLLPYSAIWDGQAQDEHLQSSALFYAYTQGNTPFKFALHIGDVGHHMIIGPTGAGKSVLLNFIAINFLRYSHSKVIIFDKGNSFLASTLAMQGKFIQLGMQSKFYLQPLVNIDKPEEKAWISQWIQECLLQNDEITSEITNEIWSALTSLEQMPSAQRTMTALLAFIQHHGLRDRLKKYTLAGELGGLLDASSSPELTSSWLCFEMESLMMIPNMVVPVIQYLFHCLEQHFTGDPVLLILDEAWLFLSHPVFADRIQQWLKSMRKKNVSVVFATQSVADAANHPLSSTLLESCVGRIFLPNSHAKEPKVSSDYYQLGLNEKQIELLSLATPKKHYYYQSSLGNSLFSLALNELALAFCSDTSSAMKLVDEPNFVEEFLLRKNLNWANEILGLRHEEKVFG